MHPSIWPCPPADPRSFHAQVLKTLTPNLPLPLPLLHHLTSLYSKSHPYSLRLSLHHFISTLRHSSPPTARTLTTLFHTCTSPSLLPFVRQLHALSLKLSLHSHPFPASALLTFYSKSRFPLDARKVFDEIPHRDEVCYSAMVVGLAQNSLSRDAIHLFADMRRDGGVCSTMYSVSGALRAAAEMAALEQIRVIHGHSAVTGLDLNVVVATALVDGYGKSGLVVEARRVFDESLPDMNLVGYNAMMAGYSQVGDKTALLELVNSMEFVPDEYSFLAILTALYNNGDDTETEHWFNKMRLDYGLEPRLEHYTCLIGALGRGGRLEEAERVAIEMPYEPDPAVWRALLSACAHHGAAEMAWRMAKRLMELDPHDDSAHVISANAFAAKGMWDEAKEVRKLMKNKNVRKEVGRSWIELRGEVHVFSAGDRVHPRREEIYAKLGELAEEIGKIGYVPVWGEMLHQVGEREKKEGLL